MGKTYTVNDGELALALKEAEDSPYIVTAPLYPAPITAAQNTSEAFANAPNAIQALVQSSRLRCSR